MTRPAGLLLFALLALCLAPAQAQAREPLRVPDIADFYQRVLTLPGAALSAAPGEAATGKPLPVFSVLYVYDRQQIGGATWVQVGSKPAGSGDGWLPADRTQDWRTMLVMQYAPRSIRERVLVFGGRDQLESVVSDAQGIDRAKQLEAQLAAGKADGTGLVAAEPAEPVDYGKRPYVMPILDWKTGRFPGDKPVLMLDLASVTAGAPVSGGAVAPAPPQPVATTKDMKIAIVFLLETNKSMQPFLDRVRDAVVQLHNDLARDGTLDRVRFGVVAYRGTLAHDPRVEYTTRIFQKLDPAANPDEIMKVLPQIKEAVAETPGWDEDAFAGMYDAMTELDWRPYAARFLIQVSDSGALPGKSPFAKYHDIDLDNIVELANRKGVAIFPMYLLTPQGSLYPASRRRATYQYKVLGTQTGDPAVNKFSAIPGGSVDAFATAMAEFGKTIRTAVSGIPVQRPIQPPPCCAGPAAPPSAAPEPAATPSALAQSIMNEVFRTQLEFIGSRAGLTAPTFVQGWVADRDLTQPDLRALDVKVFLTRNQLNGLAQSLSGVVDSAKQASLSQDTFFDLLQSLSATMAGDPNRQTPGSFTNLADSNLLPSYLKALPYRSKVLRMSRDTWTNAGMTGQQLWIDELEYKLKQYQDMYQDTRAWIDFGSGDPGDAVYPVPLDTLP